MDRLAPRAGSALVWSAVELGGSKLLALARVLVLARLLAADEFGVLAIATVGMELFLALSNVGTTAALVQSRDVAERELNAAWTLDLLRAAVVAAAMFVAAPWLADAFDAPAATPFLRLLGLQPLVGALASPRLVTLVRALDLRPLALLRVGVAALEASVAVSLAVVLPRLVDSALAGAWAVVIGVFAGAAATVVASYRLAPHRPRLTMGPATGQLLSFGKWMFTASVAGVVGHLVVRAVISRQLGLAELGVFYLGLKLTLLPNDVAGEVIRAVAFPVVSRLQDDRRRAARAFQASLTAMTALLAPVYALLFALSGPLVEHVLGPEWAGMVPVIQLLALDGLVDVLADAAKPLLLGLGFPARRAFLKSLRTVMVIILAWPFTAAWGLAGAAAAWLAAETGQALAAAIVIRRVVERPFAGLGPFALAITAGAASGAVIAWLVASAVGGVVGVAAAGLAGGAACAGLVLAADVRLHLGLRADLGRVFPAVAARLRLADAP